MSYAQDTQAVAGVTVSSRKIIQSTVLYQIVFPWNE